MRRIWFCLTFESRPRRTVTSPAALVTALIAVAGLSLTWTIPAQALPAIAVPVVAAVSADRVVLARDDVVSARIAAKAQKRAVEVVNQRTESSTTWALPDGQLRKELNPAPVRVQREDGAWADIDLDLVEVEDTNGTWKRESTILKQLPQSSPRFVAERSR